MNVYWNGDVKTVRSDTYNYDFNYNTGEFVRWGRTFDDDPEQAIMPELADIEVTTSCVGINGRVCAHCYKSNLPTGKNMSYSTFETVLNVLNEGEFLTQVAFGADSRAESNPDLFKMMQLCRSKKIVPNITVADISDETADRLVSLCGAVAVSLYEDKDVCYNTVHKLTSRGLKQVNIHCMLSKQTYGNTMSALVDIVKDKRLQELNAVVFLSLKQLGRGKKYDVLSQEEFDLLVLVAQKLNISFGFDSCSAHKFLTSVKEPSKELIELVEPCESTLFSTYVNVDGKAFPCSFADNGLLQGMQICSNTDFFQDVWQSEEFVEFRSKLMSSKQHNEHSCRTCPLYKI
jgi:radical SAM protein with 4Fe4S-binding SPASM domain